MPCSVWTMTSTVSSITLYTCARPHMCARRWCTRLYTASLLHREIRRNGQRSQQRSWQGFSALHEDATVGRMHQSSPAAETSGQFTVTDTCSGIINNYITPRVLGRRGSISEHVLINPRRPHSVLHIPGYTQPSVRTHTHTQSFSCVLTFPTHSEQQGERKNRVIKNKHQPQFSFLVCPVSQIVSVDWYKHWLTWADDYSVYGTHMLALVSLINPIRCFGEKRLLFHMLLTHTHTSGGLFARW